VPDKKTKPVKKTAKKASKSSLVTKLKAAGLTVPEGADVKEMEHRLAYYTDEDTAGYNVRLFRGWGSQYDEHPISQLKDRKSMYWLPPSRMAEMIVQTKMVAVVKRGLPLHNAIIIDVPKGFKDGSNDKSN
jgi:hypothetical protein